MRLLASFFSGHIVLMCMSNVAAAPLNLNAPPRSPPRFRRKISPHSIESPTSPPDLITQNPNLDTSTSLSNVAAASRDWWNHRYANAPSTSSSPPHLPNFFDVELATGETVRLDGDLRSTPTALLSAVEKKTTLSSSRHGLSYQGRSLQRDKSFKEQQVPIGSVLRVEVVPGCVVEMVASGNKIPVFDLTRSEPLQNLKNLVSKSANCSPTSLKLLFEGKELDPTASLDSAAVPVGATLQGLIEPTITVRLQSGQDIRIYRSIDASVLDVQQDISKATGLVPGAQQLKYKGTSIDPNLSIAANNVPIGAILDLVRRPGIVVVLPNDREVPLYGFTPANTVAALKNALVEKTREKFSAEKLDCFLFNSQKRLADADTLVAQGVVFGDRVLCRHKPSFTVVLNTQRGRHLSIFLPYETATVSDLKAEIAKQLGIPHVQQQLTYDDQDLSTSGSGTLQAAGVPFGGFIVLQTLPAVSFKLSNGSVLSFPTISLDSSPTDCLPELFQQERDIHESNEAGPNERPLKIEELTINHKGRALQNDVTFGEQGVGPGEVLSVVPGPTVSLRSLPALPDNFRVRKADATIVELKNVGVSDSPSAILRELDDDDVENIYYGNQALEMHIPLDQQKVPSGALLLASEKGRLPLVLTLIPNCNVEVFGEECFTDEPAKERYRKFAYRIAWVMVVYASILFSLGVTIQWLIKLITRRIASSRDRYTREFLETVFRSITIIAIVGAIVEILLNFDVFELKLEQRIFHRFEAEEDAFYHGKALQVSFTRMMEKLQFCLAAYLFAVFCFSMTAWRLSTWMAKTDLLDVNEITNRVVGSRAMQYAVLRYEFREKVQDMSLPGVDPNYSYFMEYLRSCMYSVLTRFVRLSSTLLAIGAVVSIFTIKLSHFAGLQQVLLMLGLQIVPIAILSLVLFRSWSISRHLMPLDYRDYLRLMSHTGPRDEASIQAELNIVGPLYKADSGTHRTVCPGPFVRALYRTRYPNKHEALFFFWRNGRPLLYRLVEAAVFMTICVVGQSLHSINRQWPTWYIRNGKWPFVIFWTLCFSAPLLFLPTLWYLLVATCTSGLIQDGILTDVWAQQRAEMIRRTARFLDLLRIEATLWDIRKAGATFVTDLRQRIQESQTEASVKQNEQLWESIDAEDEVNLPQLFKLLVSQGLNYQSEKECKNWFEVFDIDNNGGIDREEFALIVNIAKQLTAEPFDVKVASVFAQEELSIPEQDPNGVNFSSFRKLLRRLHLNHEWNVTQIAHFFEFASGRRAATSMSLQEFVTGAKRIEKETLGTLIEAVGELSLKSRNEEEQ